MDFFRDAVKIALPKYQRLVKALETYQ